MPRTPTIGPVTPSRAADALHLLLADLPADRRQQLQAAALSDEKGGPRLRGLLAAERHGELVGAVWADLQPGSLAVVWPPRLHPGESTATADALLAALCELLDRHGVRLAQAMLPPEGGPHAALLEGAGFERLADVHYLVATRGQFPERPDDGPLQFTPYSAARHDRLAGIVARTYEGSLDCRRLGGARSVEEVLAGYRATGTFAPERWLLAREAGDDVGCLLLADHPAADQCELVYMGLVPEARGRGWGAALVRRALWQTGVAGRARLVLGVDSENGPALDAYAAAGFVGWERRSVHVRRGGHPRDAGPQRG